MRPVDVIRMEAEQQLDRLQERAGADCRELLGCVGQHPAAAGRAGGRVSPRGAGATRGATEAGGTPGCARFEQRAHSLDATRSESSQRTAALLGLQQCGQSVTSPDASPLARAQG